MGTYWYTRQIQWIPGRYDNQIKGLLTFGVEEQIKSLLGLGFQVPKESIIRRLFTAWGMPLSPRIFAVVSAVVTFAHLSMLQAWQSKENTSLVAISTHIQRQRD